MEAHRAAVAKIAARVRHFYDRKEPFRIFHGSTNSTRQTVLPRTSFVDTSSLGHVLQVDVAKRTALVEPNVPMDRLVAATLKHGLVPPVVMEFPGITVGGGFSGTSGESSSFKYGFFNKTINSVEMVLANGDVITASNEQHPDLFHAAAGAVGTFGVTTLVELQLKKAHRYVETTYHPVSSIEEAVSTVHNMTKEPGVDYVDGIIYSKTQGVIVSGKLTDEPTPGTRVQRFSRPWDPWFYLHVQDQIRKTPSVPITEAIPIAEYLFRYDRGGFWVGASAFKYMHFPFNRVTRWFLDDFLHTRMLYRALHASGKAISYVVQDLALPYRSAAEFINFTDSTLSIYPLWLCPLKQDRLPTFHPHSPETEASGELKQMLNIGVWGYGPKNHEKYIEANRDLEHELRRLGGMKWFYAQTYYSEDEFWEMYDKKWYENLRKKYNATHLPSVYQKVRVDVEKERKEVATSWKLKGLRIWPLAGAWGIWKSILSGDWKIPKQLKYSKLEVGSEESTKA
ncbi:24-dehydrocholesterol reductase-like protein precursor [Trichodelitschia bisporula]|uniref:Delta(24)-sterol reductase n=1 Tax=Trichodelitschia bisporula TaxID=703511 RepID=A0A6G1I2S1_9PEZI|nr:24-dehydrocholesterol reductase-like protein precursor [Trichodelitschia bisporula]